MTYMNNPDPNDPLAEGVPGEAPAADESADAMGDGSSAFMSGEEKKPQNKGALALLGLLLVGGGGYFYMKQAPQTAVAANANDTRITEFLNNGEQHVQMMKQMLNNSDKVVQRFRAYPEKTQIPLDQLKNNPFRLKPASPDEPATKAPDSKEGREEIERQERKAVATDAAKKLRLQSIFSSGATKACLMNGKLYRLGQEVEGFKIEEIDPKHVIVSMFNGEFKFQLVIQR